MRIHLCASEPGLISNTATLRDRNRDTSPVTSIILGSDAAQTEVVGDSTPCPDRFFPGPDPDPVPLPGGGSGNGGSGNVGSGNGSATPITQEGEQESEAGEIDQGFEVS